MELFNNKPIRSAQDALLFCDYLARFGTGETVQNFAGIANVIRDLMLRVESQAAVMERAEAKREATP